MSLENSLGASLGYSIGHTNKERGYMNKPTVFITRQGAERMAQSLVNMGGYKAYTVRQTITHRQSSPAFGYTVELQANDGKWQNMTIQE